MWGGFVFRGNGAHEHVVYAFPCTPPLPRQLSARTRQAYIFENVREMRVCKQLFGEHGLAVHISLSLTLCLFLSLALARVSSFCSLTLDNPDPFTSHRTPALPSFQP